MGHRACFPQKVTPSKVPSDGICNVLFHQRQVVVNQLLDDVHLAAISLSLDSDDGVPYFCWWFFRFSRALIFVASKSTVLIQWCCGLNSLPITGCGGSGVDGRDGWQPRWETEKHQTDPIGVHWDDNHGKFTWKQWLMYLNWNIYNLHQTLEFTVRTPDEFQLYLGTSTAKTIAGLVPNRFGTRKWTSKAPTAVRSKTRRSHLSNFHHFGCLRHVSKLRFVSFFFCAKSRDLFPNPVPILAVALWTTTGRQFHVLTAARMTSSR